MIEKIARLLVVSSDGDLKLYDDYSGRGMCGNETYAVYGKVDINSVISSIDDQQLDNIDITRKTLQENVRKFRKDNLGYDTIWY
jgi:hypothetical protein